MIPSHLGEKKAAPFRLYLFSDICFVGKCVEDTILRSAGVNHSFWYLCDGNMSENCTGKPILYFCSSIRPTIACQLAEQNGTVTFVCECFALHDLLREVVPPCFFFRWRLQPKRN